MEGFTFNLKTENVFSFFNIKAICTGEMQGANKKSLPLSSSNCAEAMCTMANLLEILLAWLNIAAASSGTIALQSEQRQSACQQN